LKTALSVISGLLFLAAFVPYIRAILKGAKPRKASWIIWGALDVITIAGMLASGTFNFQIAGAVVGATTVVVLSFKHGESGWTTTDKLALAGAALGLVLWAVTRNPRVGLFVSLAVTFLGSIPTFENGWKTPEHENIVAWSLYTISCFFALAAVPKWDLANAGQPITFTVIEVIMMIILLAARRRINKAPALI
jgi:hypothetical protein